ncbi:MFS transporter [Candidatus Saccharibacteria bacterium]|nr:MFS transporter [Candidatus Saccharibacteria bacterium]
MTDEQKKLSRRFIAYQFLIGFWLVEAVWLYFYRLYMNDAQIGALDTVAFGIGLLAEIPSGALADRIGRAKTVKIGIFLAAAGIGLQALGGFWTLLVLQAICMIGFALISGADEALFFEKLKFNKNSVHWRKLITRGVQAVSLAAVVAIPVGGFLYSFNPKLTFVLCGLVFMASMLPILRMKDEKPQSARTGLGGSLRDYGRNIATGFRAFAHKNLRLYVPLILTLLGALHIFDWGILKIILMDRFQFSEAFGGIVLGAASLTVLIVLHIMHKYAEKLHEKRILTILSWVVIGAFLLAIPGLGIGVGVAIILILCLADGVLYPFFSEIFNRHAPNEQRATVISTASFLRTLPYVALAPVVGWLNMVGRLDVFLIIWSVLIAVAWAYYFAAKKRDNVIKVDTEA